MRMPEPEEDKVTATGGGLRASGSCRQLPQTPPPHLKDASPSQQLFTNSDFQTTLTTLSGLHLAHTFVLQSAWSTLCTRPHCACICLVCYCFEFAVNFSRVESSRTLRFCEHLSENFFTVKCAKTFQRVSLADLYM